MFTSPQPTRHRMPPFLPEVATAIVVVLTAALNATTAGASVVPQAVLAGVQQPTVHTVKWDTPGSYTYTVLPDITSLDISAWGAQGGTAKGAKHAAGHGARATVALKVTPGEQLQINVGGAGSEGGAYIPCSYGGFNEGGAGGFNGGGGGGNGSGANYGNGGGAGGGGASDIRTAPFGLTQRVLVAGGGGGASGSYYPAGGGGNAGRDGDNGQGSYDWGRPEAQTGGRGATQSAAGGSTGGTTRGGMGDMGSGGVGAVGTCTNTQGASGGGGGYFGGGGGGSWPYTAGGGGGGSSYGPSKTTFEQGVQAGDGNVSLSFQAPKLGPLHRIVLTPGEFTGTSGSVNDYSITGLDIYGDNLGNQGPSSVLSIAPDGSCKANSCTASIPGTHTVTARDGDATGSAAFTVLDAVRLTVTGFPSTTDAGSPHNFTVTAYDKNDQPVTGYSGAIRFSSNDRHAVLPPDAQLANGIGTFSASLHTAGEHSIIAIDTVNNATGGISSSVQRGPTSKLVVSGLSSATKAGTSHTITVTATDAYGNATSGYAGTARIMSSDAKADYPRSMSIQDSGTFFFVPKTSGDHTVTVTASGTPALTDTATARVEPNVPSILSLTGPATSPAGTSLKVTATVFDRYGNLTPNYGMLELRSSDPAALFPRYVGLSNETTFAVTFNTSGPQHLYGSEPIFDYYSFQGRPVGHMMVEVTSRATASPGGQL